MHSVRVVLAAGLAGVGALAHRLAALNPAEADWDRHWCRTGSDQEHPLPASAYAPLPEGFSHIVTSMTAPVASGWSLGRVGLEPTGKRRLFTAHTHKRHSILRTAPPKPAVEKQR